MPRQINFTVTFEDNGTEALAKIEVPHATGQRDANELASFTEQLAKKLGKIEERHQPGPHSHVHDHSSDHLTQGG